MLSNKAKFILEIIEGKLVISNKKRAEVIKLLKSRGYEEHVPKKAHETQAEAEQENQDEEGEEGESSNETKGFNYLLEMPISNLTHERVLPFFILFFFFSFGSLFFNPGNLIAGSKTLG
jgi:DNA topoisomerase-2